MRRWRPVFMSGRAKNGFLAWCELGHCLFVPGTFANVRVVPRQSSLVVGVGDAAAGDTVMTPRRALSFVLRGGLCGFAGQGRMCCRCFLPIRCGCARYLVARAGPVPWIGRGAVRRK
jgi:hypothetical protein